MNPSASHPAVTSDARPGGDRPRNTGPELHTRHRIDLQSVCSLVMCDLVSHRASLLSLAAGAVLVGWIVVQVALIGYQSVLQPAMFLAGFAVATASGARVWERGVARRR